MTQPVEASWSTENELIWNLEVTNNGPNDITDVVVVWAGHGPIVWGNPLNWPAGEQHVVKRQPADPGNAAAAYTIYFTTGGIAAGERWACDNATGDVTGPL